MENTKIITVDTTVNSPVGKVWEYWTQPNHITKWNQASPDWCCPKATNDLRRGGKFTSTMAAKDGSASFDFEGHYTAVENNKHIAYKLADGRKVEINFVSEGDKTHVREEFEMENENSEDLQRDGWQAILDNFKKYTEEN